jgi:glycosyltransferase involved in cell wall biosynthesis
MIRILHLQTELNLACGITRTISQTIKNSSEEFEHHLIALGGDGLSRFEAFNFNPKVLNLDRFSFIGALKIYFFVLKYCKKYSIQIVHSHHRSFDTIAWLLKPFIKVKTIISVQSKVYGKKVLSYKADRLIACSNSIKNHLRVNYNIDENKIKVIYNMVDLNQDITDEAIGPKKRELQIAENEFVIGFVGRINYQEKGIDILLQAFKDLTQNYNNIKLIIIGNGIDYSKVHKYIESNKLNAKLLSSVKNIFAHYNLMNVVIVPSKIEPFGIVIIEAGMMKKSVIASSVDGIPEIINDGDNGLLFKSGNVEELKDQIIRIYCDKKFGEKLADNLHRKVIESFTTDKIISQYEKLYRDILNNAD